MQFESLFTSTLRRQIHSRRDGLDLVVGAPHLCGGRSALALREKVSTLIMRFPGFPVQLGGSGALLAAFLNESRIRGHVQCSVQEIRV
jgi:hypothetical protein